MRSERKNTAQDSELDLSVKQRRAQEHQQEAKAKRRLNFAMLAVALILVAVLIVSLVYKSGVTLRSATALEVGDQKISPVIMNYYYADTVSSYNQSGYLSYMLDTSKDLSQQVKDSETGETWADFFLEQATGTAQEVYAAYQEAVKAGVTLDDSEKETVNTAISNFGMYASVYYGSKNGDIYLESVYGKGCNEKTYRDYYETRLLASKYLKQVQDDMQYTEDEIKAKYDEDPTAYASVTYRTFEVLASSYLDVTEGETATDEQKATALKSAEEAAKEMAASAKGNELNYSESAYKLAPESSKETYKDSSATLRSSVLSTTVSNEEIHDWLFDTARQEGDTTYIADGETGYYVLYFTSTTDNADVPTVDVRHILISYTEDDEDSKTKAKEEIESLKAKFEEDPTEDNFADLAAANSSDSGSSTNGGLYEGVYPGQMVTAFNDWCFDESRKPGDYDIVETNYGYHLIYFVGEGPSRQQVLVTDALRTAEYNTWHENLLTNYPVTKESGYNKIKKSLVIGSQNSAS